MSKNCSLKPENTKQNRKFLRRSYLIERLRGVLFRPRLLILPAVAFILGFGTLGLAEEIPFSPTADITIGASDTLTTNNTTDDFGDSTNDPNKTIT